MAQAVPIPQHVQTFGPLHDGMWRGRPCFVVGGGASLRGFDWSLLRGELTIGINRAFEFFEPTISFSMDLRFFQWLRAGMVGWSKSDQNGGIRVRERWQALRSIKVWLQTTTKHQAAFADELVHIPVSARRHAMSESLSEGLGHGENSGFAAVNLALCLGADPIYLLGFDMKGESGKQAHFHSGYPIVQGAHVYQRFADYFRREADAMLGRARIVNLNPDSALDCFPKARPEDVLTPYWTRPIVVAYYTMGTGYEAEARRLEESLRPWGIERDIVALPNLGSWQRNTQAKALFLREMLDKHAPRPLLYLDADATVDQFPHLLVDGRMQAEGLNIAVHKRRGSELLSGTIYLNNTRRSRELMDLWIKENAAAPGRWDQRNLQSVLEREREPYLDLPPEYCCIFDLMAGDCASETVIRHWQASRRLKVEVGA